MTGPGQAAPNDTLTTFAGGYGNIRDSYITAAGTWSGYPRFNFAMSEQWGPF